MIETRCDIFIVGEPTDVRGQVVAAAFEGRKDFAVEAVTSLPSRELIASGRMVFVFVFVDRKDDPRLRDVFRLQEKARVITLAGNEAADLRAVLFTAGMSDVLYPPFDPSRVEACVAAFRHKGAPSGFRVDVDVPVTIAPVGGDDVKGPLRAFSRRGFAVEVQGTVAAGSIVRADFGLPGDLALPRLFARIEPAGVPGTESLLQARFVGLNAKEREGVSRIVERLATRSTDPLAAMEVLAELDLPRLREQIDGVIAGIKVPALSAYERAGLLSEEDQPPARFAPVALARCRATMLAHVMSRAAEQAGGVAKVEGYAARWQKEIDAARDVVRSELATRIAQGGKEATLRELRLLQSTLQSAADQVFRVVGQVTGQVKAAGLQEVAAPQTFEKPPEPAAPAPRTKAAPSGSRSRFRGRVALGVATIVLLSAGALATSWENGVRRSTDTAHEIQDDAPVKTVGPVRVHTMYRDGSGFGVGVVDGSWYQATNEQRFAAAVGIAGDPMMKDAPAVSVHDYAGRTLAVVRDGKLIPFRPKPRASPQASPTRP